MLEESASDEIMLVEEKISSQKRAIIWDQYQILKDREKAACNHCKKKEQLVKEIISKNKSQINFSSDIWTSPTQFPTSNQLDCEIRWNSTYQMIERGLLLKPAITKLVNEVITNIKILQEKQISEEEWEDLIKIKAILLPLYETKNMVCGENYPTYNLFQIACDKLLGYYNLIADDAIITTILDPNLKVEYFKSISVEYDIDISKLMDKFKEIYNRYTAHNYNCQTNKDKIQQNRLDIVFKQNNIQLCEIDFYLSEPRAKSDTDPLMWWKANAYGIPILSKMARDYLSIQGTSTACERLFSVGTNLLSKNRMSHKEENIRKTLCLKNWLKL
ncbi:uncharacterized protein LOC135928735 [Gordionus sp. m RMFG-2023]|uniref:uncharacterized protein LOC135928735 n=1 Tax=Gordionus sp. m RMFG-2023 TaxID=3053472 RepID=UPI0031FBC7E3